MFMDLMETEGTEQLNLPCHLLLFAKRALDIALCVAFGGGVAFVVLLFPFAQAQEQLRVSVADVNLQRHDRIAFLFGQAEQLVDLRFVHQQLARSRRVGRIEPVALLERADMHVVDKNLAVADRRKRIPDVHSAIADRFDFSSRQDHARFVGVFDEIIMGSFFVLREYLAFTFLTHVHPPPEAPRGSLPDINCINSGGQKQGCAATADA